MANYCRYCGRSLRNGENCNCQASRNAKTGLASNSPELKYTNTVKKQISMIYAIAVLISIIVGFIVCSSMGDLGENQTVIDVVILILFVYIGVCIARNLVARLGMQMEMSYNLNEIRKILRDVPYSLNEINNCVAEIKAIKEKNSGDSTTSENETDSTE
ncbi:MAG: hypothetical protein LIO44_06390 [Eubacterium sp.]|nr:hypothetical protein [Eubacterium sp.]